jgi:hypothetical protein
MEREPQPNPSEEESGKKLEKPVGDQEPKVEVQETEAGRAALAETLVEEPKKEEFGRPETQNPWKRRLLIAAGAGAMLLSGIGIEKYCGGGRPGEKPQMTGEQIADMVKKEVERQKEFNRQKAEMERKRTELARKMKAEKPLKVAPKPAKVEQKAESKEAKEVTFEDIKRVSNETYQKAQVLNKSFYLLWDYDEGHGSWGKGRHILSPTPLPNPMYGNELNQPILESFTASARKLTEMVTGVATNPNLTEDERKICGDILDALNKIEEAKVNGNMLQVTRVKTYDDKGNYYCEAPYIYWGGWTFTTLLSIK